MIMYITKRVMKKIMKCAMTALVIAGFTLMCSSCLNQDLLLLDDGDFDGREFSDYDLMNNSEIELDDIDHS